MKSTHIATVWKKEKCSSKRNIIPHTPENSSHPCWSWFKFTNDGMCSILIILTVYIKHFIDNDEYLGAISTGMKETKCINIVQYSNFIVIIINVHVMLILYFILYVTASKPEKHMHVLLKLLSSVTAEWQEIGDLLGVDPNTTEELCISNFSNKVKMSKMLQSWLDKEPTSVTWDNIISVIGGPLQKKTLATEICQSLKIDVCHFGIKPGMFFYW